MICPKCEKSNQCPCINCDPSGDKPNKYIWIDTEEGIIQCCFCNSQFNEGDSLNYEWDLMIKTYKERLDDKICAFWFESKNKSELYIAHGLDEFAFRMAFREHYRVDPNSLKIKEWLVIKRDYKLYKLIE